MNTEFLTWLNLLWGLTPSQDKLREAIKEWFEEEANRKIVAEYESFTGKQTEVNV